MSQPPPYAPVTAFVSFQVQQAWFPGQQLDVEFSALKTSITAIEGNLAFIQNDSGSLANGVVGWDQLAPSFQVALRAQGFTGAPSSGPNTWFGTQSFLGANTAAIMADGAQVVVQNSTTTQKNMFDTTTGGVVYDGTRSVVYIPASSTGVLSANAFGGYVRSRAATGATFGGGVLYYGLATASGNNTCVWGENLRVVDSEDAMAHGATGIKLVGSELDIVAYETGTTIQGHSIIMNGSVVPAFAAGYSIAADNRQITFGFTSGEGSISTSGAAFYVGAALKGATNVRNTGSQGIWWNYYDGSSPTGVGQAWKAAVNANGDLTLTNTESATARFVSIVGQLAAVGGIMTGTAFPILTVQTSGANPCYLRINNLAGTQQSGIEYMDGSVSKWQVVKQANGTNDLLVFDKVANATIMTFVGNGGAVSLTPQSVLNLNPNGHGVSVGGAADPGSTNLAVAGAYKVAANQVVGARATGWTVATGTPQRSTFTTSGVTLAQLAGVVMALEQDLIAHGLIGT